MPLVKAVRGSSAWLRFGDDPQRVQEIRSEHGYTEIMVGSSWFIGSNFECVPEKKKITPMNVDIDKMFGRHEEFIGEYIVPGFQFPKTKEQTMSATLKHLRWVRDSGAHDHVNAPTAAELSTLDCQGLVELHDADEGGEATPVITTLTSLGAYELERLELHA